MMEWKGPNRRKFPRIAYPCLVKINSSAQEPFLTHTENIGVGGICIISKKEIPLSTQVEVELDLVDETAEHVFVTGHAVWVVKRKATEAVKPLFYDVGIEFDKVSDKNKARLEAAISKSVQKGYKILKPVY